MPSSRAPYTCLRGHGHAYMQRWTRKDAGNLDMDTFVLTWGHAGMDIQADVDMDMWTWTWPDNIIDMIFPVSGFVCI